MYSNSDIAKTNRKFVVFSENLSFLETSKQLGNLVLNSSQHLIHRLDTGHFGQVIVYIQLVQKKKNIWRISLYYISSTLLKIILQLGPCC